MQVKDVTKTTASNLHKDIMVQRIQEQGECKEALISKVQVCRKMQTTPEVSQEQNPDVCAVTDC